MNFYKRLTLYWAPTILVLFWLLLPHPSWAARAYLETGGGINRMQSVSNIFTGSLPSNSTLNPSINVTFGVNLSKPYAMTHFHLGVSDRIDYGVTSTSTYQTQNFYLLLRLDFMNQNLISFGYSPFMTSATRTGYELYPITRKSGVNGYLAEYHWVTHLTPEVAFYAGVSGQWAIGSPTYGPIASVFAGLRLYFGKVPYFNKERKYYGDGLEPGEYEGYRYPYGRIR